LLKTTDKGGPADCVVGGGGGGEGPGSVA
jgi:hypothetical protein